MRSRTVTLAAVVCLLSTVAEPVEIDQPWYFPALFEDFEGPGSLPVGVPSGRSEPASDLKATILVPLDDLAPQTVITRVGIRSDRAMPRVPELRGSVTLELTTETALMHRFAENVGTSPVLFFVTGRLEPSASAPPERGGAYHVFDLPGGYSISEPTASNLLVRVELTNHPGLALDMVPSREDRFLLAEDLRADSGRLLSETPVVCLWTRPAASPGGRYPEALETRPPDRLIARGPSVAELEQKVARLESMVRAMTSERAWLRGGPQATALADSIDLDVSTLFAESGRQVGTTDVITSITPTRAPVRSWYRAGDPAAASLRPAATTSNLSRSTSPYGVPTADEWLSAPGRRVWTYRPPPAGNGGLEP